MSQQILTGVLSGTDVDSAGRSFAIIQPLDGSLAGFVYGMPNARKGGPEKGSVVEILAIPSTLKRNYTYLAHKAGSVEDAWAKAKPAVTGARTQMTISAELTDAQKAERAAKRTAHRLAQAADEATSLVPTF